MGDALWEFFQFRSPSKGLKARSVLVTINIGKYLGFKQTLHNQFHVTVRHDDAQKTMSGIVHSVEILGK